MPAIILRAINFNEDSNKSKTSGERTGREVEYETISGSFVTKPEQAALTVFALYTPTADFMGSEMVNVNGGGLMNFQQKPYSFTVKDDLAQKK